MTRYNTQLQLRLGVADGGNADQPGGPPRAEPGGAQESGVALAERAGLAAEQRELYETRYLWIRDQVVTSYVAGTSVPGHPGTGGHYRQELHTSAVRGEQGDPLTWPEFLTEVGERERAESMERNDTIATGLRWGGYAGLVGGLALGSKTFFNDEEGDSNLALAIAATGAASLIASWIVDPDDPERDEAKLLAERYNQDLLERLKAPSESASEPELAPAAPSAPAAAPAPALVDG